MTTEQKTVVENEQQGYELIIIIKPEVKDEALETTISNFSKFVTDKGGVVDKVDQWGRRKLAYPIKRALEGTYVLFKMKIKPQLCKEIESNLKVSEDVLRYLLIKLNKG